ncbi:uncharacterized protein L203_104578 [Cryptococcus depauperatus CBS 7841]|uniref:Glucose receptor Git3 N-terminal domain-containing protein n=1 Tax=Cryptococcus depauperatus CBS 7841 TaxID=1295531 RepID=A0AAJ8M2D0_9TREE
MATLEGREVVYAFVQQTAVEESTRWMVTVNVVILCLTTLGAATILISMAINEFIHGRPGTTRTRIVQALIVSDLVLGITGLISSSLTLEGDGHRIAHGTRACSGLGLVLIAVLWTEHLWTVTLAFATYMMLIHVMTLVLEQKWYLLWILVWLLSITAAIVGQEVYGFYPASGICFYGDNAGIYADLIQFIPRAAVCVTITILYSRLIVFLCRPDQISISHSRDAYSSEHIFETDTSSRKMSMLNPFTRMFQFKHDRCESQEPKKQLVETASHGSFGDSLDMPAKEVPRPAFRTTSIPFFKVDSQPITSNTVNIADLPPWEHVELPPFQVGGEKFGGPFAPTRSTSLWGSWKGMNGWIRHLVGSETISTQQQAIQRIETVSPDGSYPAVNTTDSNVSVTGNDLAVDDTCTVFHSRRRTIQLSKVLKQNREEDSSSTNARTSISLQKCKGNLGIPVANPSWLIAKPLSPVIYGNDSMSPSASVLLIQTREPSIKTAVNEVENIESCQKISIILERKKKPEPLPSVNYYPSPHSSVRQTIVPSVELDAPPTSVAQSEDEEWDLMRMLTAVPAQPDDVFTSFNEENNELVPESMASYLNRKTALLMLWFPLGYILLFSVSLIRLIYHFVGDPPHSLRAISRWFVLAQGLLDAIIYGFVEWLTKRVIHRRVRRGTFSP